MNRAHESTRPRTRPERGVSILLLLGILAGVLLVAGCGPRRTVDPSGRTGELPDQEVEDFALTESNAGATEWKLYAQHAAIYDVKNTITALGVRVDFYDAQGKVSSQLTAREGEINQLTRDMTATGNVILQNSAGSRMSTQSMRFLNREQKIVSDVLVRVEHAGNVLTGVGFESDPELKQYRFRSKVNATVRSRTEEILGPERSHR